MAVWWGQFSCGDRGICPPCPSPCGGWLLPRLLSQLRPQRLVLVRGQAGMLARAWFKGVSSQPWERGIRYTIGTAREWVWLPECPLFLVGLRLNLGDQHCLHPGRTGRVEGARTGPCCLLGHVAAFRSPPASV